MRRTAERDTQPSATDTPTTARETSDRDADALGSSHRGEQPESLVSQCTQRPDLSVGQFDRNRMPLEGEALARDGNVFEGSE